MLPEEVTAASKYAASYLRSGAMLLASVASFDRLPFTLEELKKRYHLRFIGPETFASASGLFSYAEQGAKKKGANEKRG